MTFDELCKAQEAAQYPITTHYPTGGYYRIEYAEAMRLNETEAALLCARLLAILPTRMASEAVALSELIRRDKSE